MEVHLHPDLAAKLNRGAEEYVQQSVKHYVDHVCWFSLKWREGALR